MRTESEEESEESSDDSESESSGNSNSSSSGKGSSEQSENDNQNTPQAQSHKNESSESSDLLKKLELNKAELKKKAQEVKNDPSKSNSEKKILITKLVEQARKKKDLLIKLDQMQKKGPGKEKSKPKPKPKKREMKEKSKKGNSFEELLYLGIIKKPASKKRSTKSGSPVKNSKQYLNKENLVSEVAARWWYVLPDWPPVNHDYSKDLLKNGLREVEPSRFQVEPEFNDRKLLKVIPLE